MPRRCSVGLGSLLGFGETFFQPLFFLLIAFGRKFLSSERTPARARRCELRVGTRLAEPRGLMVQGEPSLAVMDTRGCWGRRWECFCSQKTAPKARAVGGLCRRALLWMPRTGCVSQGCSNVQAPACCPAQASAVPSPCELAAALGMLLAPGCPPSPRGPRRGHLFTFYLLYFTQAAWLPLIACREQAETFFLLSTQLSFCLGSAA